MKIIRILLLPVSYLYGFFVFIRNKFYDLGIFRATEFNTPLISVGNLVVGGTGKTPHIEYLIRLLKSEFYIATLSRGYGRKTKGFVLADSQFDALKIGDEPSQFKNKFHDLRVAVDGNRVRGVKILKKEFPSIQAILLDDAFQHRAIKPGISILLSDFSKLYLNDYMVPSGALREFKSGAQRADIIIITKCPQILLPIERKRIIDSIQPTTYQHIYFSYIKYGDFVPINLKTSALAKEFYFERNYTIILLTGIANTSSLMYYLKDKVKTIVPLKFPDHHVFTIKDIELVSEKFNSIVSENKIILTTEKDAMRLKSVKNSPILQELHILYIPIEIEFHNKDKEGFNEQLLHYVRANQKHSSVHSK